MESELNLDIDDGKLVLPTGRVVHGGLSYAEVLSMQLCNPKERMNRAGWTMFSAGPYRIFEQECPIVIFSFVGGYLKYLDINLFQANFSDAAEARVKHDQLLFGLFGKASRSEMGRTQYTYHWGYIASVSDMKTGDASIQIGWN